MELYNKYIINIFERYTDLKNSNKKEFDNNDLWKIFEYYSCIKLSEEYNKPFYEYDDIDPNFKELNKMSHNDTGIDCSDLLNTIVQCKLRKNTLTWKECSTFFGSQVIYCNELKKPIVRWDNLIITHNNDCTLSEHLLERNDLFIDKPYLKEEIINFCENLIINPPKYPIFNEDFELRDYQNEAIKMIKENNKNVIINLPTGTGKNSVIIYSFEENKKYLILLPRIILMDQLKEEIIKHKPKMKSKIQLIGNSNNTFNENKLITICVFNSVHLIEKYCMNFEKIFIDEAHHINKPAIYDEDEEEDEKNLDEDIIEDIIEDEYCGDDEYFSDDENQSINSENITDDIEDELVNIKNYTKIIRSFVKYNNNVYLSATIDKVDNFDFYSKDIRTMIDLEYLCDYQIHVPIFNNDPTNKNICEHLLKNYRNVIIYCNSQKEGKIINKLMNTLQLNSSEYIDCNTTKKKRTNIIEKYNNSEIPFLVNVRILVEGFDSPITKGVCFLHLPTNKTTLIQIIGRALRLHPTKTIANIILPFSSREDEKNICNFLRVIAKNDSRIRKSYESKKLGGYISIENINENENDDGDEENEGIEDIEFKYSMIYNSIGFLTNRSEIWMKTLVKVSKYIDIYNKRPYEKDKDKDTRTLGSWLSTQKQNYKNNEYIMKESSIKIEWEKFIKDIKYQEYFLDNNTLWFNKLHKVKEFIDNNNNNKLPSAIDKNKDTRKLGAWISSQKNNYKNNEYLMKKSSIKIEWEKFINNIKYQEYFLDRNTLWFNKLEKVKKYIDNNNNNKLPSAIDKDEDTRILGIWLSNQVINYKNNESIMKESSIKIIWEEFNIKYQEYFLDNNTLWFNKLQKVKEYIDINNKVPSVIDKDKDTKILGLWLSNQPRNYKNNEQIMKESSIRVIWKEFTIKYQEYFLDNNTLWFNKLQKIKKYVDNNNKIPSRRDKDKDTKILGVWISTQKQNYKKNKYIMKEPSIKLEWEIFTTKYEEYFIK